MSVTIEQTEVPADLDPPDNEEVEWEETGDPNAPYGYDEAGEPRAPYGHRKDGKPAKKRGRSKGSAGTGGRTKSLESLRAPLIERLTDYIGGGIIFISPIGAAVWDDRAERTADAILVLAARSARWKKWVTRFVEGSAVSDIGLTVAGVFTGIMVDTGRVSPNGKLQHYFHIDQIYEELYGAYVEGQNNSAEQRGLFAEVS